MFRLIFRGELLEGFERDQVVTRLARLLKQPPARIEERLFGGSSVVVKRVETEREVRRWREAFAQAGAVLHSVDEVTQAAATAQVEPGKAASKPRETRPATGIKTSRSLWLGAGGAVLILVVVAAVWFTRPLWQSSALNAEQSAIAEALVDKPLYLLGHIDAQRLARLEAMAGEKMDLSNLPGVAEDFWISLEASGIDVRQQVNHLWGAGYADAEQADFLWVVSGTFDPEAVAAWLRSHFTVEEESEDGILFTWIDRGTCQQHEPLFAAVDASKLVFGTPARVRQFHQRLSAGAPASQDLADWFDISSKQPLSLAVFSPEGLGSAAKGVGGMMLRGLAKTAQPVDGFYLGVDKQMFPPGIELRAYLTSGDAAFLQAASEEVNKALREAREHAAEAWPETVQLYDRLTVTTEPKHMIASLRFDDNVHREVADLFSSFTSRVFSSAEPGAAPQERLETNSPVFQNVTLADDFQESWESDAFNPANATAGPFGVFVREVGLNRQDHLALQLEIKANDLPNMGKNSSVVKVRVEDVLSRTGESLLPAVACGPDPAREETTIDNVMFTARYVDGERVPQTIVTGHKTVSLKEGVSLAQIDRLAGHIDYQLPVSVERLKLEAPLAGKVVEKHGLKLRFLSSDSHRLSYEYSGNEQALLHIAALNAEGQPISSGGGMSSGKIFGSGQTVSTRYAGTIASVELVLANEFRNFDYPFEIATVLPLVKEWDARIPDFSVLDAAEWKALVTDTAPEVHFTQPEPKLTREVGPVLLALKELRFHESFGADVSGEAFIGNQHPFLHVLGGVRMTVSEIVDDTGASHTVNLNTVFPFARDGGMWFNGVYQPDEERPWHKGDFELEDRALKVTSPQVIRGILTLNAAEAVEPVPLPLDFASGWQNENFSLRLQKWQGSWMTFAVDGDLSELVSIEALDAAGQVVSRSVSTGSFAGKPQINLDLMGQPHSLRLLMAKGIRSHSYPFELALTGQTGL